MRGHAIFRLMPPTSAPLGVLRPSASLVTPHKPVRRKLRRPRSLSFTLIELTVVIGIITVLTVLLVPAVTSLKAANEITNSAYAIKNLVEQARSYALINATYTWVGFFEENGGSDSTNPATAGSGRVVISIVASKDGTIVYQLPVVSPPTLMDPAKLVQVSKLVKLDHIHLRTFANGSGSGVDTFATRPPIPGSVSDNAKIGDTSPAASLRPFQYPVGNGAAPPQYTFSKAIEFTPRGECRVNNNNYSIRSLIEITFQPIRGSLNDDSKAHAIQVSGFAGNIKLFQP
jgi:type II secretory pathway pseudopilin PulG